MNIRQTTIEDLEALVPLFDAYGVFYGTMSDEAAARSFLRDRIMQDESVSLIAEQEMSAVGFTQLYPIFSSLRLSRKYLLNDLFVRPEVRGSGIGEALLKAAADCGRKTGV